MNNIKHNSEKHYYEVEVSSGFWGRLDYLLSDNTVVITHTFVPSELRGKGCGKILMDRVLTDIEKNGLKVRPVCSYAVAFFMRHEKWQHLLSK